MSEEKGKPSFDKNASTEGKSSESKDDFLDELDFDLGQSNQDSSSDSSSLFDELDELDGLMGRPASKEHPPAAKEEKDDIAEDLPPSPVTDKPGRMSQEELERILQESPEELMDYTPPAADVDAGAQEAQPPDTADDEPALKVSKLELEELVDDTPSESGGDQMSPEALQRLIEEAQAGQLSQDDAPSQSGPTDFGISPEELQALMEGAGEEIVEYQSTVGVSRPKSEEMSPEELQRLIDEAQGGMSDESLAQVDTEASKITPEELQALMDAAQEEPQAEEISSGGMEMSPEDLQALLDETQSHSEDAAAAEEAASEISPDELQALMDAAGEEPEAAPAGDGSGLADIGMPAEDLQQMVDAAGDEADAVPVQDEPDEVVSPGELQAVMDEAGEEVFDDTPPDVPPGAGETQDAEGALGQEPFDEMLSAWKAEETPPDGEPVVEEEPAAAPVMDDVSPPAQEPEEEPQQAEESAAVDEEAPQAAADAAETLPADETEAEGAPEAEVEAEAEGEEEEATPEQIAGAKTQPIGDAYDVDIDALIDGAEAKAAADEAVAQTETEAAQAAEPQPEAAVARPGELDNRTMWLVAVIVSVIVMCACIGSMALIFIYQEELGIRISLAPLLPVVKQVAAAMA